MNVPVAVVEEVASHEGEAPTDLPSLYDSIDTDALNSIVESMADEAGSIQFPYAGYVVTVDSDGLVSVEKKQPTKRP